MTPELREAVMAAQGRKAVDVGILDLKGNCSFTDYFLLCTGTSTRHSQAICDAVVEQSRAPRTSRAMLKPSGFFSIT